MENPTTVADYIEVQDPAVQERLREIWAVIRENAPDSGEKISWEMPTFVYHGTLVHFAAQKKHVGFYPMPSAIMAFEQELSGYKTSKGGVQLPYNKPLPKDLIGRMVRFRVEENLALETAKKQPEKEKPARRARYEMPVDVREALEREGLTERYQARPPYQQNDYIGWIARAKRPETREKRLRQMLDELHTGNAYMGMAYKAKL